MCAAVARTVRAVPGVPVTADVERGYGLPPREPAERLGETGAVGCGLEDTGRRTGVPAGPGQRARFRAGFRAAAGADPVLNARVDSFLRAGGAAADAVAGDAVGRARTYGAAGADCVRPVGGRMRR